MTVYVRDSERLLQIFLFSGIKYSTLYGQLGC
jgi:hypothetical protein